MSRDIVFNELFVDWKEKVYLVEGIFDAIAVGMNAIPILGSTINENSNLFKKLIKNRRNTHESKRLSRLISQRRTERVILTQIGIVIRNIPECINV